MSYLNQLQNLQGDIRARAEHATDIASNINDRKASTIEEKLNSVKDNVEMGLNATTGVAGAYHAGRKLFKKYIQKAKPKKADAEEDPAEETESGEIAEGTPAEASTSTSSATDPATATDANATVETGEGIEMQNMADIASQGVPASEGSSAAEGAEASASTTGENGLASLGYTEEDAAQLLGNGPTTASASASESSTATSGGDAVPAANEAADAPDASAGLSSAEGSSATETGATASTTASTTAETGATAGAEVAETTALDVGLDFLGPVGLAIGAIGALFEGLFGGKSAAEKAKEAKQKEIVAEGQTSATTATGGALSTGIDPSALTKASQ
jgi:hypothetical protein